MGRKDFWKSDWFLGVIVALAVASVSQADLVKSLERKACDLRVQASGRNPSERIAIIAIDDPSIANIGRWPRSRHVHPQLMQKLAAGPARVIGMAVHFSESQIEPQDLSKNALPLSGAQLGAEIPALGVDVSDATAPARRWRA
jgi:eukaryotic-like serine/threonine-protein kinase